MKMIQIRNVPDELHRRLKARAALEGSSLSDYLSVQIQAVAERPTTAELRERLDSRSRVRSRESAAAAVRAERDARRPSSTLRLSSRCFSALRSERDAPSAS
jgi:plasmid stability protein